MTGTSGTLTQQKRPGAHRAPVANRARRGAATGAPASLRDLQRSLGNQRFGAAASSGALVAPLLGSLAPAVGNQAIQRLARRASTPAPTAQPGGHRPSIAVQPGAAGARSIQRKIALPADHLSGLVSVKGKLNNSTLQQLVDAYAAYHKAATESQELAQVNKMLTLIDTWLDDHKAAAGSDKSERQKLTQIEDLQTALKKEEPLLRARVQKKHFTEEIGLPNSYFGTLKPPDYQLLVQADQALGRKNVTAANAALAQLKASIGGVADLIRSQLFRYHLKVIDPELAHVINTPDFRVKDPATEALAQQRTQAAASARHASLTGISQGQDPDAAEKARTELQHFGAAYQNLGAKAQQMAAGSKPLKALSPVEATAVVGYSSEFFPQFNDPLRQEVGTPQFDASKMALTKVTTSALNKLKPHKGLCFRHVGLFAGYSELNQPGATLSDLAFASSAKEQRSCGNAGQRHDVLEIIQSKSGREVAGASLFGPGESEVLFKPGTRFRVIQRFDKQVDGTWRPTLSPEANKYLNDDTKAGVIKIIVFKDEV